MILESKFYSNQFKNYFDQSYQLAEKKKNKPNILLRRKPKAVSVAGLKGQAILPIRSTTLSKVESIIHEAVVSCAVFK